MKKKYWRIYYTRLILDENGKQTGKDHNAKAIVCSHHDMDATQGRFFWEPTVASINFVEAASEEAFKEASDDPEQYAYDFTTGEIL
jgi:hypothetical protein